MEFKRVTLLCGHYGSGKTNIAVNLALRLRQERERVCIADLDIVNPYFRTVDSKAELDAAGIPLIASRFASSNVDLPALPAQMYAITQNREQTAVVDIGGDDRGALALGRMRDQLREEDNYEMLLVINCFRPLTRTPEDTIAVMREIEEAAGLRFTAVVNNSNLGPETTAQDVLGSAEYAGAVCAAAGLPLKMTTVSADVYPQLEGKIKILFPLTLQKKY